MSRSDAYLDNFKPSAADTILDKKRRKRLVEKRFQNKYAYELAKIKIREMNKRKRIKRMSVILASGITVTVFGGSIVHTVAKDQPKVVHETKPIIEYQKGKNLSSRSVEEINEEIQKNREGLPKYEEQSNNEKQNIEEPKSDIKIGGDGDEEVKEFLNESENKKYCDESVDYLDDTEENAPAFIYSYSSEYGVDPYIIASICYQESSLRHYDNCPGGNSYNGSGVGYMQHENPADNSLGEAITVYNYRTHEEETDYINMENACSPKKNIKLGSMEFQQALKHYKGNQLLAIQAHNFGQTMTDRVLRQNYMKLDNLKQDYPDIVYYLQEQNPGLYQFLAHNYPTTYGSLQQEYPETYEVLWQQSLEKWDILKDMIYHAYSNTSWLKWMKDASDNPYKYLTNEEWENSTYGDPIYVKKVLSRCPATETNYKYNGDNITFDLETLSVISVEKENQRVR